MKIKEDTRRNLQVSSIVIGFVTMLLMAVWSGQASAATISKEIIGGVWHITYDGRVEVGDAETLTDIIEKNPTIEWVSFNSPGGSGNTGDDINDVLYDYAMSARVESGNECMSACASAFIGGHRLSVEGTLGFHSFRYAKYDGSGRIRIEKSEIRESIYHAQYGTSYEIYKLLLNGFSLDLHNESSAMDGEFLEFKSNDELAAYYIGSIPSSNKWKDTRDPKEFYTFN